MDVSEIVEYLKDQQLVVASAESCTAGRIIALLAQVPGAGSLIECGYVVYSPEAKQRLLGVNPKTIEHFNLTSVEVAREMASGALRNSPATVAVATTGLCGDEDMDGIPAGTVCFAWAFLHEGRLALFSDKLRFFGNRENMQRDAAMYALEQLPRLHKRVTVGEYA